MRDTQKPRLLILVGPTGSGKTRTAIELAKKLDGEIISADSRYLYQELTIGTAKPSEAELAEAPHHLVNVTTLDRPWNLGLYLKEADRLIRVINTAGHLPIMAGGTGQYVRSIVQNWSVPEQHPVDELRDGLYAWGDEIGFETLHQKLGLLDAEAASKIDWRNKRRTIRALEVIFLTGRRFSELRTQAESEYDTLTLGIRWPRELLYQRIDQRIDQMLNDGLVEEVSHLKQLGLEESMKKLGAISYTEISDYLDGQFDLEEAVRRIKHNTRVYVRRQANWFKPTDSSIHWFNATDPAMLVNMLDLVQSWLQA